MQFRSNKSPEKEEKGRINNVNQRMPKMLHQVQSHQETRLGRNNRYERLTNGENPSFGEDHII